MAARSGSSTASWILCRFLIFLDRVLLVELLLDLLHGMSADERDGDAGLVQMWDPTWFDRNTPSLSGIPGSSESHAIVSHFQRLRRCFSVMSLPLCRWPRSGNGNLSTGTSRQRDSLVDASGGTV